MYPIRRFTLVSTAAAGVGTVLLASAAGGSAGAMPAEPALSAVVPAAVTITRIADVRPGAVVRLEGTVLRRLDADRFRLEDGSGTIRVVVGLPEGVPAEAVAGQRIRVEGRVHDAGRFGLARPEIHATAITVAGGPRLEVPPPVGGEPVPVWIADPPPAVVTPAVDAPATVPISTLRRGQAATVRGTVTRILDTDEFQIADETGSVRVYVGWRNRVPADLGATVTVAGIMDDDPWPVRPELYAGRIILADGRVIELGTTAAGAAPMPRTAPVPSLADGTVPVMPIAEAAVDTVVAVRGVVERILDEDLMRLSDGGGSLPVYIGWRNRVPAPVGETVTVLGAIAASGPGGMHRELHAFELQRGDGSIVTLQRPAAAVTPVAATAAAAAATVAPTPAGTSRTIALGDPVSTLGEVMSIASVTRGRPVVIAGVVERLRDSDEFVLRDTSGAIRVEIGWRNAMPVRPGDRVVVAGVADDDVLPGFRPEVYADRIQLADGRVVELVRGD